MFPFFFSGDFLNAIMKQLCIKNGISSIEKFYEVMRCQGIFLAIYFQSMQRLKILMYGGVNLKCLKSN